MTDDLFNDDTTNTNTNTNNDNNSDVSIDSNDDSLLNELVGEGKKFKTVSDLARGKKESDLFIERLKDEQAALRKQLEELDKKAKEGATLKDLMAKLQTPTDSDSDEGKESNQPLSPDELKKYINSALEERETTQKRLSNREKANNTLLSRFEGNREKAKEYVNSRAKELGLSTKELGDLSESSPQAFARLLDLGGEGVQNQSSSSTRPRSEVNTDALSVPFESRDHNYYKELKRKDSKTFWSPKVQQELIKYGDQKGIDKLRDILYG